MRRSPGPLENCDLKARTCGRESEALTLSFTFKAQLKIHLSKPLLLSSNGGEDEGAKERER